MNASRRSVALLLGAAVLMPSACVGQLGLEEQVLDALETYVLAINSGDAAAVASLYLNDSTAASVGDGRISRGWETISALLEGIYADNAVVQLGAENIVITPAGSDAAVAHFDTAWQFGRDSRTVYRGAMSVVFVRTSDGWKVAHDHTSTLPGTTEVQAAPSLSGVDSGPTSPVRELRPCTVTRIVDGDTFDCRPLGRVRLTGIDTPESGQGQLGAAATQALASLIPSSGEVQLEADVESRDRYDRALRYVWVDGQMVNWALVRGGYAVLLTYPPNVQYVEWFRVAQDAARNEGAGLWSVDGFACSPQEYRRGACR